MDAKELQLDPHQQLLDAASGQEGSPRLTGSSLFHIHRHSRLVSSAIRFLVAAFV